jgi:hypothetical protein
LEHLSNLLIEEIVASAFFKWFQNKCIRILDSFCFQCSYSWVLMIFQRVHPLENWFKMICDLLILNHLLKQWSIGERLLVSFERNELAVYWGTFDRFWAFNHFSGSPFIFIPATILVLVMFIIVARSEVNKRNLLTSHEQSAFTVNLTLRVDLFESDSHALYAFVVERYLNKLLVTDVLFTFFDDNQKPDLGWVFRFVVGLCLVECFSKRFLVAIFRI